MFGSSTRTLSSYASSPSLTRPGVSSGYGGSPATGRFGPASSAVGGAGAGGGGLSARSGVSSSTGGSGYSGIGMGSGASGLTRTASGYGGLSSPAVSSSALSSSTAAAAGGVRGAAGTTPLRGGTMMGSPAHAGHAGAGSSSLSSSSSSTAAAAAATPVKKEKERIRFTLRDISMLTTVGTGTFGRVRVVQYKPNKSYYAMKILKKSEILRLKQLDHIKSEVKILSTIQHPFIVNLYGHTQDDRRIYLLFEYVPGGELFSYLRREGRFGNDHARFYAAEISLAFDYLHSLSIVYRDLKPENLLLNAKGHMKITDFGFAKVVEDRTWTLCGTPEYLAPEIIQSKGHNKSVDWWAIGILIYEMLAGYPPFYDESPFGIYQKILAGKLEFPRHFSSEVKDLVKRLLTADKTKRLGCLKGGMADIKEHPWFAKLDWDKLLAMTVTAPYVPKVKDEKDTSNFEDYPDSDSDVTGRDTTPRLTPKEAELFAEFDTF